jgi:hypothetical protein
MATDLRTEQDLVAALDVLCSDAPTIESVMPGTEASATSTKHRRLVAALVPVAAALATAGIAVGIVVAQSSAPPADQHPPADSNSVVGVWWKLHQINGQDLNSKDLSLDIDVHGNFEQTLGGCEWLTGQFTVTPATLRLDYVQHPIGDCSIAIPLPHNATKTALARLMHEDLVWSVSDSTLTLHGSGVTATYTPYPLSGTPSRQWTYQGVGISVPASWPRNAIKCGAPTASTVIYPHAGTTYCYDVGDRTATTVAFAPIASTKDGLCPTSACSPIEIDGTPATEQFHRLPDGREIAEVRVPSRNVRVTITSPDPAFAAHLAEFEIFIVTK